MKVVKGVASGKASGPYGFTMVFLQTRWDIVKDDIMGAFQEFQSAGRFEKASMQPL